MCASERRRIPCPKTIRLQQEADAAERNQASVRFLLREVLAWFKDKMYFTTLLDARLLLAMRYRHKSNTVLGHVVLSIHEEGQNRSVLVEWPHVSCPAPQVAHPLNIHEVSATLPWLTGLF